MTPTNIANKCHAFGSTPEGTGIMNHMRSEMNKEIRVGIGLNPT